MNLEKKKDFLIKTAYIFAVIALVFVVNKFLVVYFLPFLIGLFLAYAVQKPSLKIAKFLKIKRKTAAGVLVTVCFIILAAAVGFICFSIITQLSSASNGIVNLLSRFSETLVGITDKLPYSLKEIWGSENGIPFSQMFSDAVSGVSSRTAEILPSFLFSCVITVVASFYIAGDFDSVKEYIFSLLPNEKAKLARKSVHIVFDNIIKISKGYLILMFITFLILLAGFFLMKIPNAFFLAVIISLVDIMPVLGVGTVLVPWCIIEVALGNYLRAVCIAALYLTATVVRNFAEPKIVGKQLGIPPIVLLMLIFVGLKLFGFLGMALSVITLVVIIELYKQNLIKL